MLGRDATVVRAAATLALVMLLATVAGGILIRLADREAFPTVGLGLWWAVQTVTTVGYGDAVPTTVAGRLIASLVMLIGIAFIAVLTAVVTATFIENARRRLLAPADDPTAAMLEEISARFTALEVVLKKPPDEPR